MEKTVALEMTASANPKRRGGPADLKRQIGMQKDFLRIAPMDMKEKYKKIILELEKKLKAAEKADR